MKNQFLASVLGASSLLSGAPASALTTFPHIEIVGVGEISVMPDVAKVIISVTTTKDNAQNAKAASDEAVTDLIARLEKMQIDRKYIESANLSLQPKYSYPKIGEPMFLGYQATRSITVTIKQLALLNDVLDGALKDGLNRIDNIQFHSSKEDEFKQKARLAAVEDAKSKAKSLAEGFGHEIAGVLQIRYTDKDTSRPMMYRAAVSNDVASSYEESAIVITDRVEVVFLLNQDKK